MLHLVFLGVFTSITGRTCGSIGMYTQVHTLTDTRRCSVISGLAGLPDLCGFPLSWMVSILFVCRSVCLCVNDWQRCRNMV